MRTSLHTFPRSPTRTSRHPTSLCVLVRILFHAVAVAVDIAIAVAVAVDEPVYEQLKVSLQCE